MEKCLSNKIKQFLVMLVNVLMLKRTSQILLEST